MANGSSQFSGILGGPIESLFGSDKPPRPIYRDEALRQLERGLTGDIQTARRSLPNFLNQFRAQARGNNPLLRAATLESNQALSNILNRSSDPYSRLQGLGDYLFNSYQQNVAPYIEPIARNIFNRNQVSNRARGIDAGPAGSSYQDLLQGRVLGETAANYATNMARLIPALAPGLEAALQAQDRTTAGILPLQRAGFEALENRALRPFQAYVGGIGDIQNLANMQNQLDIGNLQGYQPVKNWANRVGDMGRSIGTNISQILDWASQAASIYGGLGGMGGGGGMGGLGGLFGGGGGGTPGVGAASTGGGFMGTSPNQFSAIPSYGSYGSYGAPYNPYAFNPYTGL